jgi:hypothetical protein
VTYCSWLFSTSVKPNIFFNWYFSNHHYKVFETSLFWWGHLSKLIWHVFPKNTVLTHSILKHHWKEREFVEDFIMQDFIMQDFSERFQFSRSDCAILQCIHGE